MRNALDRSVLLIGGLTLVALTITAAATYTTRAFTLGVVGGVSNIILVPDSTVCQKPITVPEQGAFDRLQIQLGPVSHKIHLVAAVRDINGNRLATGVLKKNYLGLTKQGPEHLAVQRVRSGAVISVCFKNHGHNPLVLLGNKDAASRTSAAFLDGRPTKKNLDLVFERKPISILSLIPTMIHRASLFRGFSNASWLYWLVFTFVGVGVPLLLALSVGQVVLPRNDR